MSISHSPDYETRVHSEAAAEGEDEQSPPEIRMHSQAAAEGDDDDIPPAAAAAGGEDWTI